MASAFVSPGFYFREIDQSLFVSSLSDTPLGLVGLAKWGPVNEVTQITSSAQLFNTFGPFSGAANYDPLVDVNYPDHPMLYAADRFLRRGRRMLMVRVGSSAVGNPTALAKAVGVIPGASTCATPPSVNTTVPVVADPTTALTAPVAGITGNLAAGEYILLYTYVSANGETKASPAHTKVPVAANGKLTITSPVAQTNATSYNLYIAFAAGTGDPDISTAKFIQSGTAFATASVDVGGPFPTNYGSNVYKVTAKYYGTVGDLVKLRVDRGSDWIISSPTYRITTFITSPINPSKVNQAEAFDGLVQDSSHVRATLEKIKPGLGSSFFDLAFITAPSASTVTPAPTAPATATATTTPLGKFQHSVGTPGLYRVGVSYVVAGVESVATFFATQISITTQNAITLTTTALTSPAGITNVNVYVSTNGGDASTARLAASYATGGLTTAATIVVNYPFDKQPMALAPTTSPSISLAGGKDGEPASNATIAQKESMYIGTPETSTDPPTGLQLFRNTEAYRANLLAVPGISLAGVVNEVIDVCAVSRGDCLGLIDPPPNLKPQEVIKWHNGQLGGSADPATSLNSSWGALYWPWLQVVDALNEQHLYISPSGFAAEVMAFNDFQTDPWFAPAGLSRGKITGVLRAQYRPNQGDRDSLYSGQNAVNPITTFAANGIVIWGQRTLQREPTALDRVNVRRLLIILRLSIDAAGRVLVFQPNDNTMWRRFNNIVNPILEGVRLRRGLVGYRVVMDSTTNTPDIIEQNMAVGNVFIKPTKSAEIIVVNFIITSQSSTFNETVATGAI